MWQFGTNSVIHDDKFNDHDISIREASKRSALPVLNRADRSAIRAEGDREAGAASMVELIASTAKQEDVDLFPRFDLMKRWTKSII